MAFKFQYIQILNLYIRYFNLFYELGVSKIGRSQHSWVIQVHQTVRTPQPKVRTWQLPKHVMGALALTGCLAVPAQSLESTIELVVPTAAQGSTDLLARMVAKSLTQNGFGYVQVRNMPGRSGALAAAYVAAAAPNGRTLLVATPSSHGIAPALEHNLPYDPVQSFTPIVLFASAPYLLVVKPERAADQVAFTEAAKLASGGWTYSSTGTGGPHHLVAEFYFRKAGLSLRHRPATGGAAALNMLQNGEVQVMLPAAILALPRIQQGQLKALAVTGPQRLAALPDVPTFNETGVQMSMVSWYGLMAPAGLPNEQSEKLASGVLSVLTDPLIQKSLSDMAINVTSGRGADFIATIKTEMNNWKSLVSDLGLQVDLGKTD